MIFWMSSTAIGSTPAKGIEGEIVYFPSIDALEAAPAASVKGKIAFVDHCMKATQDGSSYGYFGAARRQGPSSASKKGACFSTSTSTSASVDQTITIGSITETDVTKVLYSNAQVTPVNGDPNHVWLISGANRNYLDVSADRGVGDWNGFHYWWGNVTATATTDSPIAREVPTAP